MRAEDAVHAFGGGRVLVIVAALSLCPWLLRVLKSADARVERRSWRPYPPQTNKKKVGT